MTTKKGRQISERSKLSPKVQSEIAFNVILLEYESKFQTKEEIANHFNVTEECVNDLENHLMNNLDTIFKQINTRRCIDEVFRDGDSSTEPTEVQGSERREPEQVLEAVIAWNDSGQGKVYLSLKSLSEISTLKNQSEAKKFLDSNKTRLDKHYEQHKIPVKGRKGSIPWDEIFENYDASQQKPASKVGS